MRRAFTLVEVVLALGIIAFSVIAIVGLLPVGYRTGRESRQETRAAYLAEQLAGDLRASGFADAAVFYGTDAASSQRLAIDLRTAGEYYLAADAANRPAARSDAAKYQGGTGEPIVASLARVTVTPDPLLPALSRVEIEVSTPASAALDRRARFTIVTLIGDHR